MDRLTRSVAFLSRLLEAGVDVRFADLPQIEGATGRFCCSGCRRRCWRPVAISARTKGGVLAAAKKRGKKLGAVAATIRRAMRIARSARSCYAGA